MDTTPETEEARKARLLEEAKTLKAPVDANWSADQLEKVVSKKRATVAAAKAAAEAERAMAEKAKAAAAAPDGEKEGDDWPTETAPNPLQADLDAMAAENARLAGDVERLTRKTKDQEGIIFGLQSEGDALRLELFNMKQKFGEIAADKAETSEDFGGKKEAAQDPAQPAPAPAAKRPEPMVKVTVTKHGHDKIFTGRDDGSRYSRGAVFECPAETAATLEANGMVETD